MSFSPGIAIKRGMRPEMPDWWNLESWGARKNDLAMGDEASDPGRVEYLR